MTLQQAIDKFITYSKAKSKRTGVSYQVGLNHFKVWLDGSVENAEDLTTQQARDFAVWLVGDYRTEAGTKLSKSALYLYLVSLLRFYNHLITDGTITGENFIRTDDEIRRLIRGQTRPPIEKKLPPPEAVKALLEAAATPPDLPDDKDKERRRLAWLRDRAVIYCLESSGARVGEIAGLRRRDLVDKDRGAWVKGKGQKERFIRFSTGAWIYLQAYKRELPGGPHTPLFCRHDRGAGKRLLSVSTLTIQRSIQRLAEGAGILETFHLTPHSLRHYFATRYLQHTGDLALTQDALGHADPATTRIYAKTSKAQLIKAHGELFD